MATKARLHWFWRGMIAVLLGAIAEPVLVCVGLSVANQFEQRSFGSLATIIGFFILSALPSMTAYILLTSLFGLPPYGGFHRHRWLAMIAIPLAAICNFPVYVLAGRLRYSSPLAMVLVFSVLASLAGLIIYGALAHFFGREVPDGELRCRKCDHILRGLSEPRCPECGEVI